MVPDKGTESNSELPLEQGLTAEDITALFETLAHWNEYLEKHVPELEVPRGPEL